MVKNCAHFSILLEQNSQRQQYVAKLNCGEMINNILSFAITLKLLRSISPSIPHM